MASLRPSRHTCIRAAFSAAGFRKWQRHARHRLQVPSCSARGSVWGGCHLCKFWIPSSLSKTEVFKFQCSLIKKQKPPSSAAWGSWEGAGLGSSVSSVDLTASACVQGSVEKERAESSTSLWLWAQNQCQGAVWLCPGRAPLPLLVSGKTSIQGSLLLPRRVYVLWCGKRAPKCPVC